VCDGNTVNIFCGIIKNPWGFVPHWRIIKRDSSGSVISDMDIRANDLDGDDGLEWIYDLNNPEDNRLVVGPVDETYNQSSYQCVSSTNPVFSSTIGTLTVAGEILHIYVHMHVCKYLFAYCLLA